MGGAGRGGGAAARARLALPRRLGGRPAGGPVGAARPAAGAADRRRNDSRCGRAVGPGGRLGPGARRGPRGRRRSGAVVAGPSGDAGRGPGRRVRGEPGRQRAGHLPHRTGGRVVFCTGLSGAGKSTIAARVVELLVEGGSTVTLLDGDEVRHHLSAGLGFSREDRDTNVLRIGWVAAQIAKHGGIAVCAPIAPYAEVREAVRREVEAQAGPGSFVLVHVATSLADCEARDRKGLYAKARRGEIPTFTGISDPYETPTDAEVTVETAGRSVDECAQQVLDHVRGTEPATR
ncbi:adenylyl-sulfate kinase [Blastococcus brunescens]|uniref:Adenylyl-sulfate kinase n=1 Tax=Blastococcus brunescens TaxID=1564165 RepID=A0ABZ1B5L5_9ACTN|nr:adenylyl-sulfate kinase [Blastococcus sp. BMG 8361]WRL64315.1 adenylyl-sulfate kinase [Blastococcus sp. BMG 8361]